MTTFDRFFIAGSVVFTIYISFILAIAIIADIRGIPMPQVW